ncbi:MAG: hypothetical protein IPL78_33500 [Chloroflexi bacterium]|nr:hypothetical protein [Chloroflexota bacterium]
MTVRGLYVHLPLYLERPTPSSFMPTWSRACLDQQRTEVLVGHISGDQYLQQTYERPWYELYDRDKPVIVGHRNYTNTLQPFVYEDRVFGLDTSVYHGLSLTGLVLPDFRFVTVRASQNHWHFLRLAYEEAIKKTPGLE